MSLIESALQKLRRAGEGSAEDRVPGTRATNVAALALKLPIVTAEAKPEAPLRRISIDLKALREAGYLPEEGLERRFADQYRRIKRPLIEKALAGDADMRLVMVSSALPGDGKTFTSINLALSMARERDVSVLLVDADAPKARISEVFGIRREPGLLDALTDHSLNVESLVQHTDMRGLEILPAGKFVDNSTELFASARMRQIAIQLGVRNTSQLILFDSAPLLVSSEARALTRIPGQIILVARARATPRRAIVDAIAQVDRSKLRGLVLNHASVGSDGEYYYEYSESR